MGLRSLAGRMDCFSARSPLTPREKKATVKSVRQNWQTNTDIFQNHNSRDPTDIG